MGRSEGALLNLASLSGQHTLLHLDVNKDEQEAYRDQSFSSLQGLPLKGNLNAGGWRASKGGLSFSFSSLPRPTAQAVFSLIIHGGPKLAAQALLRYIWVSWPQNLNSSRSPADGISNG